MEPSGDGPAAGLSRRLGLPLSALNLIQSPLAALLEYTGILRPQPDTDTPIPVAADGEVTIRIVEVPNPAEIIPVASLPPSPAGDQTGGGGDAGAVGGSSRDSSSPLHQRYEIQQAARWIERFLPFSLLLLVVFIRQHLQDTMVRLASMAFKCVLLMYYKDSKGYDYRKQGQMLTLVEYLLLLYRALLPTPVWYRFFLNKEYGSLFSSLTTGLYLTFKLTSVVEKVQSFLVALKALSRKEVHYGSHATIEQVIAAGDLCAICQEKMHAPILLRCKHIFCEDCVSEWFERERTCPLCRALVKPAGLRSFGDGSTSLYFQLF